MIDRGMTLSAASFTLHCVGFANMDLSRHDRGTMPRIADRIANTMASRAKRARSRGRAPKEMPRFGKLEPRYTFTLNPYRDARFTCCPIRDQPAKLRKFVFVIHVDPMILLAPGLTCRFCPADKFIICHQDELEAQLAIAFERQRLVRLQRLVIADWGLEIEAHTISNL